MDTRTVLIVAGLACDLVGAFLLSIPLVWNARAAGRLMLRFIWRLRRNVRDYLHWGTNPIRHPILTFIELNLWGAFLALLYRWYLEPGQTMEDVSWWLLALWGLVAATLTFILNLVLYWLVRMIGGFFLYVALGDRDKNVGFFGLLILCLGFVLQAWVNFIT